MRALRIATLLVSSFFACKDAPKPAAAPLTGPGGVLIYEVSVTAKGFEPERVEAPPGRKILLRVTRRVSETCADAVDFQDDPVRHTLPMNTAVDIPVIVPATGELAFACPMKMIRGSVAAAGHP